MQLGKRAVLDKINSPRSLRYLSDAQLEQLCAELREELIEGVSATGGHLASNLGVVELTVALHLVFQSPTDQIVWDVGHQCYTHKLLTGRRHGLEHLRQKGGMAGFPKPDESIHDAFVAGHASTSLSVADGLARGKELLGEEGYVIAVIGDGALTGGLAYEGLNNLARKKDGKVIVVLNDNKMSISKNVGGLTKYLSRLRTTGSYYKLKNITKSALKSVPYMGEGMVEMAGGVLSQMKDVFYRSGFFEDMGYTYMGPVDGHDLNALRDALEQAKTLQRPVLLHVETVKGKGFPQAESNPGAYHGVSKFDPKDPTSPLPSADSFSDVFGRHLTRLAAQDNRICAVTAAMKYATGLYHFSRRFQGQGRFFDVGIAEAHGVTFCAGLASKGLLPVFAVYSSFLQRGYDQLIHDCSIYPQHVVLAIDRAGLVGEDGETNQGIFDCAYLSSIPGTSIYAPATYGELQLCLEEALYRRKGLCAVRYPRGAQPALEPAYQADGIDLHLLGPRQGKTLLVTYGRLYREVSQAHKALTQQGEEISLLKLTRIWPLEAEAVEIAGGFDRVFFLEEGIRWGGIGEHFALALMERGYRGRVFIRAIDNRFVSQGTVEEQLEMVGLNATAIVKMVIDSGKKGESCEG